MDTLIDAVNLLSRVRDLVSTQKTVIEAALRLSGADVASITIDNDTYLQKSAHVYPNFTECQINQVIHALCPASDTHCDADTGLIFIANPLDDKRIPRSLIDDTELRSFALVRIGDNQAVNRFIGLFWFQETRISSELAHSLKLLASATFCNLENIELQTQLNTKVLERTGELMSAQQEAEKANNFKSRFLSAASHDLRQPLQLLNTQCAILKRKNLGQDVAPALEKMSNTISSMSRLLDTLLNLNQLEAGHLDIHVEAFALDDLLSELVDDFSEAAQEKGLVLSVSKFDIDIHSDAKLLRQILKNFIANAIKYTTHGQVTVSGEQTGDLFTLSVSDTGPGIPEEKQAEIFEPFFRMAHHRNQKSGFGLGLTIVKNLSELLNHPISVSSNQPQGTVFSLQVPCTPKASQALIESTDNLVETENDYKATILYLEDDEDILDAVQTLLDLEGYKVVSAESLDGAIASIKALTRAPDLVITDNRLANGDSGLEVVKKVRAMHDTHIPAIMLTGYTEKAFHEHALHTVQKVLSKPVDADVLLEEIANSLSR